MFLTRLATFGNAWRLIGRCRKPGVPTPTTSTAGDYNTIIRAHEISEYSARLGIFHYCTRRQFNFHVLASCTCHRLWAASSPWLSFKMNSSLKQSEGIQLRIDLQDYIPARTPIAPSRTAVGDIFLTADSDDTIATITTSNIDFYFVKHINTLNPANRQAVQRDTRQSSGALLHGNSSVQSPTHAEPLRSIRANHYTRKSADSAARMVRGV
jgi:hypothetical protein